MESDCALKAKSCKKSKYGIFSVRILLLVHILVLCQGLAKQKAALLLNVITILSINQLHTAAKDSGNVLILFRLKIFPKTAFLATFATETVFIMQPFGDNF